MWGGEINEDNGCGGEKERTTETKVDGHCSIFYLRNISKIRHRLDRRTTATLVHAYATSWLDNGNALLGGHPPKFPHSLDKRQAVY